MTQNSPFLFAIYKTAFVFYYQNKDFSAGFTMIVRYYKQKWKSFEQVEKMNVKVKITFFFKGFKTWTLLLASITFWFAPEFGESITWH